MYGQQAMSSSSNMARWRDEKGANERTKSSRTSERPSFSTMAGTRQPGRDG